MHDDSQLQSPLLKPIYEVNGDLFSAPCSSSLAHCISRDCKLGAGIAKTFRQQFGKIEELKNMEVEVEEESIHILIYIYSY